MNPDILYEFQSDAVSWLAAPRDNGYGYKCEAYHGLLGHEMGLGKTAIALAAIKTLVNQGRRGLFLVPGSTIIQWQRQYDKWVLDGEADEFGTTSLSAIRNGKSLIGGGSYIMSHSLLARKEMVAKLAKADFDFIVLDEAHKFGADSSKRLTHLWAVINLSPNHFAAGRIALSGTPVRNYAKEIRNIAHFLKFEPARTAENFTRKYLTYDRKALYNPRQFHADFGPFYLRKTVAEVQKDLPEVRRTKLYTEINNPALVAIYNRELDMLSNMMANAGKFSDPQSEKYSNFSLLTYLIKLRQITGIAKAAEPAIIDPIYEYLTGDDSDDSADKKKVVIGIHHHLVNRRLRNSRLGNCKCGLQRMAHFYLTDDLVEFKRVARNGCANYQSAILFYEMVGGQTQSDRNEIKERFISEAAPAVLLLSVKAAGEGVDGLQYACSRIYTFERMWNPADEEQFEKRVHRNGQKFPVQSEITIATGTVDEFFDDLIESKRRTKTQVEDPNWESNPVFLRQLAERVISSRLPSPRPQDIEEFERLIKPKNDIDAEMGLPDFA